MPCSRSDQRLAVAAVTLLCVLQLPNQVLAHVKGLYKTRAEAEQSAKELADLSGRGQQRQAAPGSAGGTAPGASLGAGVTPVRAQPGQSAQELGRNRQQGWKACASGSVAMCSATALL